MLKHLLSMIITVLKMFEIPRYLNVHVELQRSTFNYRFRIDKVSLSEISLNIVDDAGVNQSWPTVCKNAHFLVTACCRLSRLLPHRTPLGAMHDPSYNLQLHWCVVLSRFDSRVCMD
jgi:hypothetical protein